MGTGHWLNHTFGLNGTYPLANFVVTPPVSDCCCLAFLLDLTEHYYRKILTKSWCVSVVHLLWHKAVNLQVTWYYTAFISPLLLFLNLKCYAIRTLWESQSYTVPSKSIGMIMARVFVFWFVFFLFCTLKMWIWAEKMDQNLALVSCHLHLDTLNNLNHGVYGGRPSNICWAKVLEQSLAVDEA